MKDANKKYGALMSEVRGLVLVLSGVITLAFFFSWWLIGGHLLNPWLVASSIFALLYGLGQIFGSWFLYLATHQRNTRNYSDIPKQTNLTVDVFVTACGEDFHMIERSLEAACDLNGKHKTWLLDDLSDPRLKLLSKQLGAGYLERDGHEDAKAGNVNAALEKTDGDIVVIFDIDHIPSPKFLERTIWHFEDPSIGFIQVMPTFSNNAESWVAQAAAETSLDFYNPTSKGMDGLRSVTKMGTNSLIRRTALESIGGYQSGLAEDLATSLKLHAQGWESVYVAEPLAPGLVPSDLTSWFTQQLKWARGVFELLLTSYFSLFSNFSWGQRIAYTVRTTKYWIGLVTFIHLSLTLWFLFLGTLDAKANFEQYLWHLFPLVVADSVIRTLALRRWHYPSIEAHHQRRAVALVYATWPIYTLAWFMAMFRLRLKFRPTPKEKGHINIGWLAPQIIASLGLLIGISFNVWTGSFLSYPATIGFATIQLLIHITFLWYSMPSAAGIPVAPTPSSEDFLATSKNKFSSHPSASSFNTISKSINR